MLKNKIFERSGWDSRLTQEDLEGLGRFVGVKRIDIRVVYSKYEYLFTHIYIL